MILICVLLALTYVVVGLRLWARLRIAKNPGIDDALIAFNMIPLTGLGVAMCLGRSPCRDRLRMLLTTTKRTDSMDSITMSGIIRCQFS